MSIMGLLPCPFCGSEKLFNWESASPTRNVFVWCVVCEECDTEGPHVDTDEEAVLAWNTRK